jgi:hypothetical protein
VLGAVGPLELGPESEFEPGVATEIGAVPVADVVAAAPEILFSDVGCGGKFDARVENVVLCDEEMRPALPVGSERVLVASDVLE